MSGSDPDLEAILRAIQAARRGDLGVRLESGSELAREWNAFMAESAEAIENLTAHARAVARGDVSWRFTAPVHGPMEVLKTTVNTMTDMLAGFGDDIARSARQLLAAGAPADADTGARDGLWRALIDNVNLTEQIAVSSRYKSEFLANMSHELRTPLNSMLILSRLLAENADGNLTARQVEYARTVHGAGTDLLALINDILDLSRIEAGKMPVEIRVVALAEIVRLLERDFRPVADHRGIGLVIAVSPAAPPSIPTDPQRLLQVLKNLLSNAFKFTARGEVRVSIAPTTGGRIELAVADTGIGIPPDKLDLVFEAFQQADGSTARKYGGTGLGLSISRGFARLLGGDLRADSAPDRGSTFTLSLPAEVAVALPPAHLEPSPPVAPPPRLVRLPGLAGHRVLVVDDDIRNIFSLVSLLESQDLRIAFANHGHEALDHLAREPTDLVLMDMTMPDLDGYEVMRRLRADPRHASLPIIAVTARALAGDRERCLAAGATDYLAKPIDADRLLAMMADLLASVPSG